MKKYLLEIIVFVCGMGIMVFELVGSRILAPYVGTTIMVWSALIGVILAFLSAGYWWGGKMADKKADYRFFSWIIFLAAVFVGLTGFIKLPVINFLDNHINSFQWEAIWASFILFGPGSFFMAAVSPYAVRLRIANLKESGRVVGNLYSISTIGSIVGTFLTGMILVPLMGNTKIVFSLAIVLLLISILAYSERLLKARITAALVLILSFAYSSQIDFHFLPFNFIHSAYLDIALVKGIQTYNGVDRPTLSMFTGSTALQSEMFTDKDDDLVVIYNKFFRYLSEFFHPQAQSALVIGGGGYSVPKDLLERDQSRTVDVVEIDPKMTQVAKQYFNVPDDPRLVTYNQDGRTFLNRNKKKYDEIFIDSFKTFVAPFQLTTLETAQKVSDSLTDNGVVLINLVQSINGDTGKFFRAEYATYKKVFPQVYVFRVELEDPNAPQNLIMVATKSPNKVQLTSSDENTKAVLTYYWDGSVADDQPIITDDFASVADYMLPSNRATAQQ